MADPKNKKQKVGGQNELVKKCNDILDSLKRRDIAYPFLEPVDWKALKLPTYPKTIKNPMDLGTVEKKLNSAKYATTKDFQADVQLVWSNAMTFNQEGSEIYAWACQLKTEFDKKLASVPSGIIGKGSDKPSKGDDLIQCKKILKELRAHKDATPFNEPVDWKALGIPDYPKLIKNPMDLGTIEKRLNGSHYTDAAQIADDVDIVWTNAMTYNQPDSWIHQSAKTLQGISKKKFAGLIGGGEDLKRAPSKVEEGTLTFEMKQQLNINSNSLSSKDLYGMVSIVQQYCKAAVDQSNPDEVEIDIDSLDYNTFIKVDKYVKERLAQKKKKQGAA